MFPLRPRMLIMGTHLLTRRSERTKMYGTFAVLHWTGRNRFAQPCGPSVASPDLAFFRLDGPSSLWRETCLGNCLDRAFFARGKRRCCTFFLFRAAFAACWGVVFFRRDIRISGQFSGVASSREQGSMSGTRETYKKAKALGVD